MASLDPPPMRASQVLFHRLCCIFIYAAMSYPNKCISSCPSQRLG